MGQTGHGQIGLKIKGETLSSSDKTASKCSNINTDLIENAPKTLVKKIRKKNPNMLIMLLTVSSLYLCQITNKPSNTHVNPRTQVDC